MKVVILTNSRCRTSPPDSYLSSYNTGGRPRSRRTWPSGLYPTTKTQRLTSCRNYRILYGTPSRRLTSSWERQPIVENVTTISDPCRRTLQLGHWFGVLFHDDNTKSGNPGMTALSRSFTKWGQSPTESKEIIGRNPGSCTSTNSNCTTHRPPNRQQNLHLAQTSRPSRRVEEHFLKCFMTQRLRLKFLPHKKQQKTVYSPSCTCW